MGSQGKSTSSGCSIWVVFAVIVLFFSFRSCFRNKDSSDSSANSKYNSYSRSHSFNHCSNCNKEKPSYSYTCQKIGGYDENGNIKYSYETKTLCSDCAEKLENSGKYINVHRN